ncbi:hypothetical protein [Mangrovibacillus cuniculi]|uniref:Lipoprotein n=1 Tax=Mangrovibacillus cuniculi TaxID=2593652 RepID=A0A7S8CCX2_9BACI|nr:hypothetical protein [Mangrovibacillus cuniculi]QPC47664.1 hypothetical protein G8O30_12220 [Mangrovibacillus cuniculi]
MRKMMFAMVTTTLLLGACSDEGEKVVQEKEATANAAEVTGESTSDQVVKPVVKEPKEEEKAEVEVEPAEKSEIKEVNVPSFDEQVSIAKRLLSDLETEVTAVSEAFRKKENRSYHTDESIKEKLVGPLKEVLMPIVTDNFYSKYLTEEHLRQLCHCGAESSYRLVNPLMEPKPVTATSDEFSITALTPGSLYHSYEAAKVKLTFLNDKDSWKLEDIKVLNNVQFTEEQILTHLDAEGYTSVEILEEVNDESGEHYKIQATYQEDEMILSYYKSISGL